MMNLRNVLMLFLLGACMLSCNAETGEKSSLRGVGNAGESALEIDNNSVALDGQRRRLFSFWSIVMEVIQHGPCIGPLAHHRSECNGGDNSDGTDGDGSAGGDYNGGDRGDGASGVNGYDNYDAASGSGTSSSGIAGTNISKSTFWLLAVAAAAATAALIAAVVGQRRNREERHQLSGSVARRISLFTNLADNHCLCGDRPDRVVEMNNARDYQLA